MAKPAMPMKSMNQRELDDDVTQFGLCLVSGDTMNVTHPGNLARL